MRRLPRRTLLRAGASSGAAALLGPLHAGAAPATPVPGSACDPACPCHGNGAGHCPCLACDCPPGEAPTCPPPLETGACVPLALGRKHKNGLEAKLRPLLHEQAVPSVLAATVFQRARRYASGADPANELETAAFEVFRGLAPDVQAVLRCSLDLIDALPTADRDRVLAPEVMNQPDQPLSPETLAPLLQEELLLRASVAVFGDPGCVEERPGLQRPRSGIDAGEIWFDPLICRINGLRTVWAVDDVGSLTPEELQQVCVDDVVNGEVVTTCEVQMSDCPGQDIQDTCLRVQEFPAGGGVTLQGVNYYDTNARVLLTAKAPGTEVREVEAHVCGDLTTPATEMIGEGEFAINDCRVQDRLAFRVPDDLPEGIYHLQVFVTDPAGEEWPSFGPGPVIRVVPSPTAGFQIAAEELECVEETSPGWAGSDEVGLRVNVVPVSLSFEPGAMLPPFEMRFGDVDSDNTRRINQSVFRERGIGGVVITITGHEIDDDEAYEKQIEDFADAFAYVVKSEWEALVGAIGGAGGLAATALFSAGWGAAIGAAIALAINIGIALWAPADLIIEDTLLYRASELAALTSANFPSPPVDDYTSPDGIDVKVESVSKGAAQYVERREYKSGDSTYRLTLRYNRM